MNSKFFVLAMVFLLTANFVKSQDCKLCDSCPVYKASMPQKFDMGFDDLKIKQVKFKQKRTTDFDFDITFSTGIVYGFTNLVLKLTFYDADNKPRFEKITNTNEFVLAETQNKTISFSRSLDYLSWNPIKISRVEATIVSAVVINTLNLSEDDKDKDVTF